MRAKLSRPTRAAPRLRRMLKPLPGNMATPCLAESFIAAEDSLTYDFVIRQGIKFHNGEPVTAEDVKFQQQSVEFDHKKRAAILEKMQRLVYDRSIYAPIW